MVVLSADYIFLLLIGSVRLRQYEMSDYTYKKTVADLPTSQASQLKQLHKLLPKVKLLQLTELIVAGIISVLVLSELTNPVYSAFMSTLAFAVIASISRLKLVQKQASKLFESTLNIVLKTTSYLDFLWFIVGVPKKNKSFRPESTEDLLEQVANLPSHVIGSALKQRLVSVIDSESKVVKDVMTTKRSVVSVKPSATLGPIVLSDLQKSGHRFFPVVTKNNIVEGILDISKIANINMAKQNKKVSELIDNQLCWVEEDTSTEELIQAFLFEKQYILLVRNLDGDYTGVVTIADLMKHLIGVEKD